MKRKIGGAIVGVVFGLVVTNAIAQSRQELTNQVYQYTQPQGINMPDGRMSDATIDSINRDMRKQNDDMARDFNNNQKQIDARNASNRAQAAAPVKYYVNGKEIVMNRKAGGWEYADTHAKVNPADLGAMEVRKGSTVVTQ